MAYLTPNESGKKIKAGSYERLYLLYGKDTGALEPFAKKLAAKLCPPEAEVMNLHSFDARELDAMALEEAMQVLPMFAERVVVRLTGLDMEQLGKSQGDVLRKIIADIPDTTVFIIEAGGEKQYKNRKSLTDKNKRFFDNCAKYGDVIEFSFKTVSETARSIVTACEKRGSHINKQNAEYLAQICLCETAHVNKELDKLAAYAYGKEITREAIDALCIKKIETDGFSLAKNILAGNALFVFQRLGELKSQNYESTQVLAIIGMSLTDIYRARLCRSSGRTWQDCAEDFGYPKNRDFAVRNAYNDCMSVNLSRLRHTIVLLSDLELKLKTVSMTEHAKFLAVEQFAANAMA